MAQKTSIPFAWIVRDFSHWNFDYYEVLASVARDNSSVKAYNVLFTGLYHILFSHQLGHKLNYSESSTFESFELFSHSCIFSIFHFDIASSIRTTFGSSSSVYPTNESLNDGSFLVQDS
mmetsp:Transcript_10669/g.12227  ORF Transcript_10669/g.12227 Transcript_10669/m.12227 type:complete len:119 (-) Transcript_10669:1850-2206(-)